MDKEQIFDIKSPCIGIGTFSVSESELPELLQTGIEIGYKLIDTAFKYKNETLIGNILKDLKVNRNQVLIETKAGSELLRGRKRYLYLDKISIKKAIKRACERLKTDYIDIFLIHAPFKGYEKSFQELLKFRESKIIKLIGICNINYEQLQLLYEKTGAYPDVVQVEVHPYFANLKLCEFCLAHEIIVEARSPFAHGDALEEWANESRLQFLAVKYKKTILQIILKWIQQRGIVPIPRTNSISHLRENIDLYDFSLTDDEIKSINEMNRNLSYGYISKNKKNE